MKTNSVIIPTFNGANKILKLIDALALQTCRDFETIVVVDGSTDNTLKVLREKLNALPGIKIIEQPNKGRAAARNTGAVAAKGDLLIFFDDDIDPAPDCVEQHMQFHAEGAARVMFGKLLMDNRDSKNDFYNYRYATEQKWIKPFGNAVREISFDRFTITSQNMSVPREVFKSLHGFDERLNDSEDFDFGIRALLENVQLFYNPMAFSWHRDFVDIKNYIYRQREYYAAKRKLLVLHPEYKKLLPKHFTFLNKVTLQKKFIAGFFRHNSLWNLLFGSILFRRLVPQKTRFRIYEVLIYSSTSLSN